MMAAAPKHTQHAPCAMHIFALKGQIGRQHNMRLLPALVLMFVSESLANACPDGRQDYRTKSGGSVCIKNEIVDFIECVSNTTGGETDIKIDESSKAPPGLLSGNIKSLGNFTFNPNQYKDFTKKIEKKLDSGVFDKCYKLSGSREESQQERKVENRQTTVTESGYSHTKETDGHSRNFSVIAQCPDDFPRLIKCQGWSAEGNTGGEDPFAMQDGDHARKRVDRSSNQCVCEAHHDSKKFTGPGHWIKCSVTAVCSQ
jgi:hypothetical protein